MAAAAAGRGPEMRAPAVVAALVVAADLPDVDFLGLLWGARTTAVHQAATHSVAFALAAAVPLAWLLRRRIPLLRAWCWLAAAGLVHLGLDLTNYDALPPIGIPLLWPFSDARWHSPVTLFPGTDRSSVFNARNLREALAELGWLLPLLLVLARERIAGLFRRAAATAGPAARLGKEP